MKLKTKSTTDFFANEYCNFASYDNIRKIPSLIDGQKNAARKILWYNLQKNVKNEIKVSQLDSKVAESEEYLHGSMAGVIVNLAQDYVGTNNMNLLSPEGNFGTRLIPEASAARYIYTYGTKDLFEQFNREDDDILEHQTFEGHKIEPKFMLPKLPMLLINGAEGISSGFATKILPRDPKEIQKYIKYYLDPREESRPLKPFKNKPFYRGFKGTVQQGEDPNQWIISGNFQRKMNKIHITELPIGYSLKSYIKVLDKLEDDKKIISYQDLSNKTFEFIVQFNRKYLDSLSDEELIKILKLEKKVSENYTVIDENNVVQIMSSVDDIMQEYKKVKTQYLQKRKEHQIKTFMSDIKFLISKYVFIDSIIKETLIITKRETEDILDDLDNIPKIIKQNNSYDYLMNMNIRSLTQERMKKLMQQIKDIKADLDLLKTQTIQEIWLNEL